MHTEAEVVGLKGRFRKRVLVGFPGMPTTQTVEVPQSRFRGSDNAHPRVGDRFVTEIRSGSGLEKGIKPSKEIKIVKL